MNCTTYLFVGSIITIFFITFEGILQGIENLSNQYFELIIF